MIEVIKTLKKLNETPEAADDFKSARIKALEEEIRQARRELTEAEATLRWAENKRRDLETMSLVELAEQMVELETRAARTEQCQRYRERTMSQIVRHDKAVLRAGSQKSTHYTWIGLTIGCLPGWYFARHYHMGELLGAACLVFFAFVGLTAGGAFFDSQFVVDEYDDGSVFRR